ALNPLVFDIIEPFQGWIRSRSNFARMLEKRDDPLAELPMSVDVNRLTGHIVLVGYGEVGRRAGEALARRGMPIVVVEQNRETVESLRERDIPAVYGDAAEPGVLIQAHIARAQMLVVTTPDAFRTCRMIETARALRPSVEILARVYSDEEAELLRREGADRTFRAEHELALGMTRSVLEGVENQRGA
ncbi:MAG TPA: NAD(P)-binding protein, partial [Arenicellales bacterium]|nr:NAD(P)-binding protein [Arenicellales bacterium]